MRERCLARTWRTIKNDRPQPVGLQEPGKQLPFAQEMLLPDELGQRRWPHAGRERLGPPSIGGFGRLKKRFTHACIITTNAGLGSRANNSGRSPPPKWNSIPPNNFEVVQTLRSRRCLRR